HTHTHTQKKRERERERTHTVYVILSVSKKKEKGMVKEAKAQAKVRVGIETLWKALVKDLRFIIPKLMPNTVEKIELIHGNGGLGSVFLFHLGR
uniref:Uncharacterized protein n=1 Tax=Cucumis melo TaxID=3656 RepID=A0A9I9EDC5_CUCME